jgi:hypothetical protein
VKRRLYRVAVALMPLLSLVSLSYAEGDLQWQPFAYSDLQGLKLEQPQYKQAWLDLITANNRYYRDHKDTKYSFSNAPSTEAHFYVTAEAQVRTLLVTVINSAEACKTLAQDPVSKTTLKTCPLRLVMQDHAAHSLTDGGIACFVEYGAASNTTPADINRNAMYGTYDRATNAVRLNAKFANSLIDQCAVNVTLPAWPKADSEN